MFRELRATAPQTYYTFRASNGTADVLYVLLILLTALGLQALFSRGATEWGARVESPQGSSTLLIKIWKPPQTCDNLCPAQPSHRRRATKIKLDFSRWIFTSNKKVKILLVFTNVFEFSSVLKKNERFSVFRCFTDVFDCFLKPSSKWRFYVIFRIVKKQLGFVGKSRTSSDEVEKWIWELEKKGTFFGADFACSRITYNKYS